MRTSREFKAAWSWVLWVAMFAPLAAAAERRVDVADADALGMALREAKAGTRIVLKAGRYRAGVYASSLVGTAAAPIIIEGADAKDKPLFEGGTGGIYLSQCAYVTVRNIAVRGQSSNGINFDDGGKLDAPAHHILLEGIDVSDIGRKGKAGNDDPIKLSGVDDSVVRGCTFEGWTGQAVDMVGCHRMLIEGCRFAGKAGYVHETGPQAKGGSSDVTIRTCTFVNVSGRGVNLGGSTGMAYFRPPGVKYEAKDITVEGCRFVGGLAPVSFVGVDGAVVRYNTIYRPDKWVARILQETTEPAFVPCRNGRFERNLIVFQRERLQAAVNVGGRTDPGSFTFVDNFWYCEDAPARSRPELPSAEPRGVYGTDPGLKIGEDGVPGPPSADLARKFGADALPKSQDR